MSDHSWSSSQPVVTHCQHGLDLRLNPRCYLCAPTPPDALREAAQLALDLLPDLSVAYHQVGSLRDHADPKDKTGWNLHGIETCEDVYCLDALASLAALRAVLQPK